MSSKKAGKQRMAQREAHVHVRRKRMRARLVTDDPDLKDVRSVTVRVGDEVELLRGDFSHPNSVKPDSRGKRLGQTRGRAGIRAKVATVDTGNGFIFVDGLTQSTADGKEEAVPVNPSNVIVTKLYEGDPLRIRRIMERAKGGVPE
ncbi:MAG: 60S ribosomal protein L26 [Candidatus Thalassarchaeaceae archaeon]|nr:60S ribosomal protein L26 [Candidatus Thalassarchaeaceae archaeon]MDP6703018.1 60S ribosomal protein L26 [Candidatus Thalassarchaeaceae archaeon]MDP7004148.1 60S ribosomal protein L26 [Candidatus Thalassarchaeaceae archaeon]